ncbi:MAG: hypothetical protein IPM21_03105 [Acidobacteria bacterium]|nr:hypothetical protein [Acidobacteriota bacterium]
MSNAKNEAEIIDDRELRRRYLMSATTAWRLRNRRHNPLPHFFVGGRVRYRASSVQQFFEETGK